MVVYQAFECCSYPHGLPQGACGVVPRTDDQYYRVGGRFSRPACPEAEIAYRTVGLPLDTPLVGQAVAYAHAKRD